MGEWVNGTSASFRLQGCPSFWVRHFAPKPVLVLFLFVPFVSFCLIFWAKDPSDISGGEGTFLYEANNNPKHGGNRMLRWAAIFFVIALIAALLGFTGVAGAAANIAVFLFYLFVAIFVILLLVGLFAGRRM
jgi:uncharacterized membrane protein YtjA (UPF0391 family)